MRSMASSAVSVARVYLSSELAVFYPGEARVVPDVFAVLDVENHPRMKWVVDDEKKGIDFVLEVHVAGDARKDQREERRTLRATRHPRVLYLRPRPPPAHRLPAGRARPLSADRPPGRALRVERARPRARDRSRAHPIPLRRRCAPRGGRDDRPTRQDAERRRTPHKEEAERAARDAEQAADAERASAPTSSAGKLAEARAEIERLKRR